MACRFNGAFRQQRRLGYSSRGVREHIRGPIRHQVVYPPNWGTMKVFRSQLRVRAYELDSFGHANHAVFLNYLEQARFEALAAGGFSYEEIQARGWAIHVVRVEVDYRAELMLDDALEIETWIADYRRTTMVFGQRILRSRGDAEGSVIASESQVVAVWIGENRRPMRVPAEMRVALGAPSST